MRIYEQSCRTYKQSQCNIIMVNGINLLHPGHNLYCVSTRWTEILQEFHIDRLDWNNLCAQNLNKSIFKNIHINQEQFNQTNLSDSDLQRDKPNYNYKSSFDSMLVWRVGVLLSSWNNFWLDYSKLLTPLTYKRKLKKQDISPNSESH
jgi:uncharacterized protein YjbI with pentapeptide repeats